jgi:hypothetical protein
MLNRNALLLVAGAAIFALDATAASAQAKKPTSTKRIPIAKEAPGEVVAPRVDTVTLYKTDTLRLRGRPDTLRVAGPTVMIHDTIVQSVPMVARHIGGMYIGLGGGVALPYGAIRTVNEPGEIGQLQVGWQGLNSPLGFRLDGTWAKLARNPEYGTFLGEGPNVMNLNAGVRLDLPFFNATLGSSVKFRPYLIGGGSYVRYNNLRMKLDSDNGTVVGGIGNQHAQIAVEGGGSNTADNSYHGDWGFNFGGGLGFHAGKKEMFIESRAIRFNHASSGAGTNLFHASYQVPIVFGVNWF